MNEFTRREWLNEDNEEAMESIVVTDDAISVSDGYDTINLDFYIINDEHLTEDSLEDLNQLENKIDVLFDVIKDYRKFLLTKIEHARGVIDSLDKE